MKTPEEDRMITERELTNRGPEAVERGARRRPAEPPDELTTLKARIARARNAPDKQPHCAACFQRGRDAALQIIDGKD